MPPRYIRPPMAGHAPPLSAQGLCMPQGHHKKIFDVAYGHGIMCNIADLQFLAMKPSIAINISNIACGPKKCGGLTRIMRWPPLRAREVLWPTKQHDPRFLNKLDTFPLDTERLARRWCGLQGASGQAYLRRGQTFTTHPTRAM